MVRPVSGEKIHDLIIVGAGPAGLQAAVYANYEGIGNTLVLDSGAEIGGQAGMAQLVENDASFPGGVTGADMVGKMIDSALALTDGETEKPNLTFEGPTRVEDLARTDEGIMLRTDDGMPYLGRVALLTTGVELRQLKATNIAAYRGRRGVNYGGIPRSVDYSHKKVFVVGGANSAGQSALTLAEFNACDVNLLIRGESIVEKMSRRLIDKIEETPNITVRTNTTLEGVKGDEKINEVAIKNGWDKIEKMEADEVFVFIGSIPKTSWLPPSIEKDEKNYIVTGRRLSAEALKAFVEITGGRTPYDHETSVPGIFAAGDVRSGTKRRIVVAKADGALAVDEIFQLNNS